MKRLVRKFNILRCLAFILATLLICVTFSFSGVSAAQDSGKLGKMKWSFSGGTLEIVGKGEMPDFTEQDMAPWNKYNTQIRRIDIDDRITYIGKLAFYDCSAVIAVELSDKVKTIGDMAFAGCSSMESITMPKIETLGEYAFSRCFKLDGVILPATLKKIGACAFYRCESLSLIRIPSSVSEMGGSVFAYCSSLISVVIDAPIKQIPEWTFYGCTQLETLTLPKETTSVGDNAFAQCDVLNDIYHNGSDKTKESFLQSVIENNSGFENDVVKPVPEVSEPTTSIKYENDGDTGSKTKTEVVTGDGADIITNIITGHTPTGEYSYKEEPENGRIEINVTIHEKDGWDTLVSELERQFLEQGALEMQLGDEIKVPMVANISLLHGSIIYGKTLESLVGKDLVLKLCTPNGSRWSIDCSQLRGYEFKKSYDLEYITELYEDISKAHKKVFGEVSCFWIDFADRIDFPATIELYIDMNASRQSATLYEKAVGNKLQLIQSVMVAEDGFAYYKMGNINKGKRYIAALNVANISAESIVRPENSADEGDWLENYVPVTEQYKITDVRGFMGLTMKEFTKALIFGIIGIAFVVFVVVLAINFMAKKKALNQVSKK